MKAQGGCREKEGGNGDTVSRTLTKGYRTHGYLSSDKLRLWIEWDAQEMLQALGL